MTQRLAVPLMSECPRIPYIAAQDIQAGRRFAHPDGDETRSILEIAGDLNPELAYV